MHGAEHGLTRSGRVVCPPRITLPAPATVGCGPAQPPPRESLRSAEDLSCCAACAGAWPLHPACCTSRSQGALGSLSMRAMRGSSIQAPEVQPRPAEAGAAAPSCAVWFRATGLWQSFRRSLYRGCGRGAAGPGGCRDPGQVEGGPPVHAHCPAASLHLCELPGHGPRAAALVMPLGWPLPAPAPTASTGGCAGGVGGAGPPAGSSDPPVALHHGGSMLQLCWEGGGRSTQRGKNKCV
jgi:hypothetical protein